MARPHVRTRTLPPPRVVKFKHRVARPLVTRVAPSTGGLAGGKTIRVYGYNFSRVRHVSVGTTPATGVHVISSRKLTFVTPAHWAGQVNVRVTTRAGLSRITPGDHFTFVAPTPQAESSYTPSAGTVVADSADIISVSGGNTYDFPQDESSSTNPWVVTLQPAAVAPATGSSYFLAPGNPVFPSGLSGVITDIGQDANQHTTLTVSPQTDGVLDASSVNVSGTLTDHAPTSDPSTSNAIVEEGTSATWVRRASLRPRDDSGSSLTSEVNLGEIPAKDFDCGGVELSGSISEKIENVQTHFQVEVGLHPYINVWVSYEPTVSISLKTTAKVECELPATFVNEHKKIFVISDTGATIAFAPDASFSVDAEGSISLEQHSFRMIGIVTNPDGSYKRIHGGYSDPMDITADASLNAEIFGGVQAEVGELDMVGVGLSAGAGLKASVDYEAQNLQYCTSLVPFLRASVFAYLNLWVKEWKLQAWSIELDLPKLAGRCYPIDADNQPGGAINVSAYMGEILRVEPTGTAYYIASDGTKQWIPDGGTYLCFADWHNVNVVDGFTQDQLDAVPSGSNATCTIPQAYDSILRVSATGASYYVDTAGVKHWIPDGGTYLCFRNWEGKQLLDNLTQDDVDAFPTGDPATCQIKQAYDRVVRVASTGASYYVDNSGTKHWIPNGGTYECLLYWKKKTLLDGLSQADVDAFPNGDNETCQVTEASNSIVRVGATGTSYYVDDSGYKHWIPNGGTYECLIYWQGAGLFYDLPQEAVDAIPSSSSNATCTPIKALDSIVRVGTTGTSYYVDNAGYKHWIPNGGTYDCLIYWQGVAHVYDSLPQEAVDALPSSSANASCTVTQADNMIVRVGATGTSYYVDTAGYKHWIPDGGTYDCLIYWQGVAGVYSSLAQGAVDAIPSSSTNESCTATSRADYDIVRVAATGAAYWVDGSATKHWIPNGGDYDCLVYWQGVGGIYYNLDQGAVDAFPTGSNDACTATSQADGTIVRVGATGASYYVDGSATKHWIPNGGTFNCLHLWYGVGVYWNLDQGAVDAFPQGNDDYCIVAMAENTIVRETNSGTAFYVDGNAVRHWIQDGPTYNCLVKQGVYVYHDLTWDWINTIPQGSNYPKTSC